MTIRSTRATAYEMGAQSVSTLLSMSIVRDLVRRMNTKTRELDGFEAVPIPAKHGERIPKRSAARGLTCTYNQ
jgi:hypothetical protein